MAAIHVITDGTVALPVGEAEGHGITIVPQNVLIGDEAFRAGIDISLDELFDRMAARSTVPIRTSQASPGQFLEAYRGVLAWGVEIVSLHLPSSLSGTVDSARAAVRMLGAGAPVTIVETAWTSSALGFLALRAAEAGGEGASREDIVDVVNRISQRMGLLFVVDDLSYLHRGGGLGRAAAFLDRVLKVKPILELADGAVEPLERARTTGGALVRLAELLGERLQDAQSAHVGLITGRADAEAAALATYLETRHRPVEMWIAPCDPAVAVHTGPGVFGAAYYTV